MRLVIKVISFASYLTGGKNELHVGQSIHSRRNRGRHGHNWNMRNRVARQGKMSIGESLNTGRTAPCATA